MTANTTAPDNVAVEVTDVTPVMAAQWLKTIAVDANTGKPVQRKVRKRKVEEFAGAMGRGEWRFNFGAISFSCDPERFGDDDQHLVDGQHRLAAIVESGVTLPMVVGWGAPSRAEETLDTGTKRTLGDMLVMRGETDTNNLAAAIRWLYRYLRNGDMRPVQPGETVQQLLGFFAAHPSLCESVLASNRQDVRIFGMPRSMTSTLYHLASLIDVDDRDAFFAGVSTGIDLERNDPRWVLREWCMRSVTSGGRRRPQTWLIGAVAIKAWNAWREGRSVQLLVFKSGGSNAEQFPRMDGLDDALADDEQAA